MQLSGNGSISFSLILVVKPMLEGLKEPELFLVAAATAHLYTNHVKTSTRVGLVMCCSDLAVMVVTLCLSSFNFALGNMKLLVTQSFDTPRENSGTLMFVFSKEMKCGGSIGTSSYFSFFEQTRVSLAQSFKKWIILHASAILWDNDTATATPPHSK
ncbi:hypothetical protein HanRHA438_Chr09g0381651 [Helianthus annuus]|nr:hypothetical protein HanRHA438_Chr09g0381651 [Helianthus annuus]